MVRVLLVLAVVLMDACAMFRPPALKPPSVATAAGVDKIHIAIDSYGIPFIKANSINEAMYGLGFMHARDRLFQLDLMRHAALGRASELFGERGMAYDKKLRVLTYRLDEQVERLSMSESLLLDSYVRGVNDGARHRGRTAEHFLLGATFEEFSKRDVIAIARLQAWQLGADLFSEITRLKIAKSNWSADAKREMLSAIDDRGSSIITDHVAVDHVQKFVMPDYLRRSSVNTGMTKTVMGEENIVSTGGGASNAWAIAGHMSSDGHAILMNDPHLPHNWPSNFYLATLSAGDFFVTGASFVGLPSILIGSSKNLAFGVTASFLNTQDSVLLNLDKNDPNFYVVDGKKLALVDWPQQFCLNKKGQCFSETYQVSMFGPVIKNQFDKWIDQGDVFAVQWTGFNVEQHTALSHGFIDLALAKNVTDGVSVIKAMTLPGVNLVVADTAGNIAYSYAGLVPKRDHLQNSYMPLDGQLSASRWSGFLDKDREPSIINPKAGYIITANQSIYARDAIADVNFAKLGAPPLRALRIKERIEGMLKDSSKIDFNELSSIQLDDTSVEAKGLAPLLGAICIERFKNADHSRMSFAKEVAGFNGSYNTDSLGALPYELLIREIVARTLRSALGDNVPEVLSYTGHASYTVKDALSKALRGQKTAIFNMSSTTKHGLPAYIGDACEQAYLNTVKKAGKGAWAWRWGRHHYLQRQSPLASVPLIGGWFRDKKREVAGIANSPMAEAGLPVTYGANLRFKVKLTNPPKVYAVIDSGNSGTVGDKNAFDQAALWHEGKSIEVETDWDQAIKKSVVNFQLDG